MSKLEQQKNLIKTRGIYLLPNLFTVSALFSGFYAIIAGMKGHFSQAAIGIFVAMIFPSTLRDLIAYSIILLILVFRPHGFFGEPYSARLRL